MSQQFNVKPTISRKRNNVGMSLLAKKQKKLTTTIEKVIDEPIIDNRVSVIEYAPKRPIEIIDISDDEERMEVDQVQANNYDQPLRFANWTLVEEREPVTNEKYRRVEQRAVFDVEHNITESLQLIEYQQQIDDSFEAAMRHFLDGHQGYDMFSAKIEHDNLNTSIYLSPQKIATFDKTRFLNKIFMVSQSNKEILLNGQLKVEVMITKKVIGSGKRTTKAPQTYTQERINKTSVVTIQNTGKY
jgi:hypothetical protein